MPKKLSVVFKFSDGRWEAHGPTGERLAHAHNLRSLRSRVDGLKGKGRYEERVEVPHPIADTLEELRGISAKAKEYAQLMYEKRLEVGLALMQDLRLGQNDAAEITGVAQSYLAKMLADDGKGKKVQGKVRRPARRPRS